MITNCPHRYRSHTYSFSTRLFNKLVKSIIARQVNNKEAMKLILRYTSDNLFALKLLREVEKGKCPKT